MNENQKQRLALTVKWCAKYATDPSFNFSETNRLTAAIQKRFGCTRKQAWKKATEILVTKCRSTAALCVVMRAKGVRT